MAKKLLLVITHSPAKEPESWLELKTALALSSSLAGHQVKLLFSGEGVYFGLAEDKAPGLEEFWRAFPAVLLEPLLEEEALLSRGLKADQLRKGCRLISRREFGELFTESRHCLIY